MDKLQGKITQKMQKKPFTRNISYTELIKSNTQ